jgi:hypothetical protein
MRRTQPFVRSGQFAHLTARAIASVVLNTVRPEPHRDSWIKHRHALAGPVIAVGNVFLRASNSHIRMFVSAREWAAWELHSYRTLHGPLRNASQIAPRTLRFDALPGDPLRDLVARGTLSAAVIHAAARELRRVHALPFVDGANYSHGDPHLGNFLFDAKTDRAYLLDFETRHEPGLSACERFADDLLVVILDLAGRVHDDTLFIQLATELLRAYDARDITQAVVSRFDSRLGELERILWISRAHASRSEKLFARIDALVRAAGE